MSERDAIAEMLTAMQRRAALDCSCYSAAAEAVLAMPASKASLDLAKDLRRVACCYDFGQPCEEGRDICTIARKAAAALSGPDHQHAEKEPENVELLQRQCRDCGRYFYAPKPVPQRAVVKFGTLDSDSVNSRPCNPDYGGCGSPPGAPCVAKPGSEFPGQILNYYHAARKHPRSRTP